VQISRPEPRRIAAVAALGTGAVHAWLAPQHLKEMPLFGALFLVAACLCADVAVRLWRSDFMKGGVDALKATVAPGPAPVKSEAALRVAMPLLAEPVADRPNWTIPRLRAEIEAREGVSISRSQLSKALRKKSSVGGDPGTR